MKVGGQIFIILHEQELKVRRVSQIQKIAPSGVVWDWNNAAAKLPPYARRASPAASRFSPLTLTLHSSPPPPRLLVTTAICTVIYNSPATPRATINSPYRMRTTAPTSRTSLTPRSSPWRPAW